MKLWVDDIRNAPDDTWHVARTVTEAIRAIHRFHFEVISLDNDISHQIGMGELSRPFPCGEMFSAVAYYIIAKYKGYSATHPRIILHTSNQVAGDDMAALFDDEGFIAEKKYMGAANRLEMEL